MKRIFLDRMSMMAILFLLPFAATAQEEGEMSFSESEVTEAGKETPPSGNEATTGAGEAAPTTDAAGDQGEAGAAGEPGKGVSDSDVLSALGDEAGLEATASLDAGGKSGALDVSKDPNVGKHPIWAVQRIYVLRARRVNLDLGFGVSMNDPYVQHQGFNASLMYYITEVLAIGVSGNFYLGLGKPTSLNFSSRRATHQVTPINEYAGGGQLNFMYVPIFGKFAMFKQWILHWDVWVIGGGGFLFTRPKPVIDPDVRDFKYNIKYCFNVGIGWRIFFTRFLGISLELRDYIYPEELESLETWPAAHPNRTDESQWLQEEHALTNNVMLSVGLTLMIPFTVKYKLKK